MQRALNAHGRIILHDYIYDYVCVNALFYSAQY